ncbi:MAG: carbonate dehydratase [bacterium]
MDNLRDLIANNRSWAAKMVGADPCFFTRLVRQQSPKYLWIGCSDSRVPANEIVDLDPGELFVHRNVANIVVHTDLNCLSVIQYAVDVLKVEHVMVCGHYGCGGVQAALLDSKLGLIDNWLRHVRDVMDKNAAVLANVPDERRRIDKLCELNVIEQVLNVCETTIVQAAWGRGQKLAVHGWIYGLADGLVRDLGMSCRGELERVPAYHAAVAAAAGGA